MDLHLLECNESYIFLRLLAEKHGKFLSACKLLNAVYEPLSISKHAWKVPRNSFRVNMLCRLSS
ncbi:hypothetical protein M5K25_011285 [Dendrobium thyrsiflorum]|uniref:Uncharacterized protein n=1 Tax=Dendrobium thyrsiflorum TaxID=117978 RepID=A0ABD0V293_DENTH